MKTTSKDIECISCHKVLPAFCFRRQLKEMVCYTCRAQQRNQRLVEYGYNIRHKYGLTPEDYAEMLEAQGGQCALCHKPPSDGKKLYIDHDHATGIVRSLLCTRCNAGLGYFRDNPIVLRRAAAYLEQWSSKAAPEDSHQLTLW